eukprot:gene12112-biopygen6436
MFREMAKHFQLINAIECFIYATRLASEAGLPEARQRLAKARQRLARGSPKARQELGHRTPGRGRAARPESPHRGERGRAAAGRVGVVGGRDPQSGERGVGGGRAGAARGAAGGGGAAPRRRRPRPGAGRAAKHLQRWKNLGIARRSRAPEISGTLGKPWKTLGETLEWFLGTFGPRPGSGPARSRQRET